MSRCEMPVEMYWRKLNASGLEVLDAKRFCRRRAVEVVETGVSAPLELCRKHAEATRRFLEKPQP